MCEQCVVNPLYFGQPIPGYTLILARREGNDMPLGSWGLVECNDPTFTFTFDFNLQPDTDGWTDALWKVWRDFNVHPTAGYDLVTACMSIGYSKGDIFIEWLMLHLRSWLIKTQPEVDADPFPRLDQERATNYTPWIAPSDANKHN